MNAQYVRYRHTRCNLTALIIPISRSIYTTQALRFLPYIVNILLPKFSDRLDLWTGMMPGVNLISVSPVCGATREDVKVSSISWFLG